MNQDSQLRPTVVVIGGGYGGIGVAKALDADVDVVLVEPKDAFVHNIGALRALVEPAFLPKMRRPRNVTWPCPKSVANLSVFLKSSSE